MLLDLSIEGRPESNERLQDLIRFNYGIGAPAIESLLRAEEAPGGADRKPETKQRLTQDIGENADDAAIVAFVNHLLQSAHHDQGTDVHIEPFENMMRVRVRIDGVLHEMQLPPEAHRYHSAIVSRLKVMAHLDIAERRLPQDGRIQAQLGSE